ncbi:hypothetical protein KTO58_11530 [Chitinophaga pendula]|uniref:poly(3-hydroxyalkanoate) depolymerase n=1 Tax=Chitinophaga TaxID=79328 RepID=UPI0012FD2AC7|nr:MULTISPECIES: poly(3-hydroxyalkanoate) depolymerase [Chitinophaga]UCJ09798.1 hypothetical protein KTO58_11530 [Chitinophaga pendula]
MTTTEIFRLLVINLSEIIPYAGDKEIDRSDMLSPLGADSIGRAILIEKTLEDLHLNVPRPEFHSATNLGELADLFYERYTATHTITVT